MFSMTYSKPAISVIIPTTCEAVRKPLMLRAIDSVLTQTQVDVDLIVVVNGNRVSEEFYEWLEAHPQIRVSRLEKGSLPFAQRHGRSLVEKEYFTLLDDDDELLDFALEKRADLMLRDRQVDVVVSNGYITYDGIQYERHVESFDDAREDPFAALLRRNWLVSCGALFRTSGVPIDCFDGETKFHEWTLLAVRIMLLGRQIAFLDDPTFRKHEETEGSLSKSHEYRESTLGFLKDLQGLDLPLSAKRELRSKIGRTCHAKAVYLRNQGRFWDAWAYHLKSLNSLENWKFLTFSRKLFVSMPKR